jgi:hypothetical protein
MRTTENMTYVEIEQHIGDLQERLRLAELAMDNVLESEDIATAHRHLADIYEANASVDMVQRFVTPRVPMWIGVEIPTGFGFYRICLGINQEGGNEVSFLNEADLVEGEKHGESPWCYGNAHQGPTEMVVSYGEDGLVFDDNHELKH